MCGACHTYGCRTRGCPRSPSVVRLLGFKFRRQLALSIREQRLVRLLGPDGQGTPDISGALGAIPAITAITASKLDLDDIVVAMINRRGPAEARVPGGAGHPLPLPVDHKVTEVKGAFRVGLPAYTASYGTTEAKLAKITWLCAILGERNRR